MASDSTKGLVEPVTMYCKECLSQQWLLSWPALVHQPIWKVVPNHCKVNSRDRSKHLCPHGKRQIWLPLPLRQTNSGTRPLTILPELLPELLGHTVHTTLVIDAEVLANVLAEFHVLRAKLIDHLLQPARLVVQPSRRLGAPASSPLNGGDAPQVFQMISTGSSTPVLIW